MTQSSLSVLDMRVYGFRGGVGPGAIVDGLGVRGWSFRFPAEAISVVP